MQADLINPFLESAKIVIQQVANVDTTTGQLGVKKLNVEGYVWIHIGMTGQMQGDIIFGLAEGVAMKMASVMMGGFTVTELDEMTQSAISELSNMISGNASTLLYNQGLRVDITPPKLMQSFNMEYADKKALAIPLIMSDIGELDIQVIIV
jgi:chemotaxis protein CheX